MSKRVLMIAMMLVSSIARGEGEPAPSECEAVHATLRQIHKKLYDVDTRPLAIEEYRNYRGALEELNASLDRLDGVCKQPPKSTAQTLYKKTSFQTVIRGRDTNPCGGVDYRSALSEFEASAIRECYKEGFETCQIKLPTRIFNRQDSADGFTWTCKAEADILLDVTR